MSDKDYLLDNIVSVGNGTIYTSGSALCLPQLLQSLLSSTDKVLQTLNVSGILTQPLDTLLSLIKDKGGRLLVSKITSGDYVYVFKDHSYIYIDFAEKTKNISVVGYVLDPMLVELGATIEKEFISKIKKNLIFSIIRNSYGLTISSMGDGSSPLIKENYLPEVLEEIDYVIASFSKSPPGGRICILNGEPGCHRKGQKLLMFDGSIKLVEDIVIGDQLMGPDSKPREVLNLCRGREEMVEISPVKGTPWVVNKNHILSLMKSGSSKDGTIEDVKITNWMSWSKSEKAKNKLFRTPIHFDNKKSLSIDPYILGVLIGDGSLHGTTPNVSSMDHEIVSALKVESKRFGLSVHRRAYKDKCPSYSICFEDGGRSRKNPFMLEIKKLGLNVIGDYKFLPLDYKLSSSKNRLKLLAGLLDTDGHLSKGTFEYVTKSKILAQDVAFLARSLGFSAYPKEVIKCDQNGTSGLYYRMSISGDINRIPTKIKRKIAGKRRQIKDVLRTGFSIKHLPIEDYYGFTLDSDGRYLLEDFTVTHNTGKTHLIRSILMRMDCVFLIVPSNLIDSLDKPEFMPLLISVKNDHDKPIIMIIEDGDACLVPRKSDNISTISSLLNLSDGILGSIIDIKMIISTNAEIKEMDQAIMRPGRLCRNIHVGMLPHEQAQNVYRRLMKQDDAKLEYRNYYTLAEIYDMVNNIGFVPTKQSTYSTKRVIGFNSNQNLTVNSSKLVVK